jgi:hypothetical protein
VQQCMQPSRTKGPCGLTGVDDDGGPARGTPRKGTRKGTLGKPVHRDARTHAPGVSWSTAARTLPPLSTPDFSCSSSAGTHQRSVATARGITPDPIPNSEVKPRCADGTAGAARWESTAPPTTLMQCSRRTEGPPSCRPRPPLQPRERPGPRCVGTLRPKPTPQPRPLPERAPRMRRGWRNSHFRCNLQMFTSR